MKFNLIFYVLPFLTSTLAAGEWGYHGDKKAERWGDLKPEFTACKDGKRQSPIELNNFSSFKTNEDYVPKWTNQQGLFNYINNGYSLTVDLKQVGIDFILDCKRLSLAQFHAHTPAEHTIDGKVYDLEVHFVFTDKAKSKFQVFGVFFQVDKLQPCEGFFNSIKKNDTLSISDLNSKIPFNQLNLEDLYNKVNGFKSGYVYRGSLTTPPCTEAARFIISDKVLSISKDQLDIFKSAVHGNNARPIQSTNFEHKLGILDFKKCDGKYNDKQ